MRKPRKRNVNFRKLTMLREDVGKYLLDVSKLVLGSIVLGTALRYEIPRDLLLTGGIGAVTVLFIVGLILGIRVIKPGEKAVKPRKRRKK